MSSSTTSAKVLFAGLAATAICASAAGLALSGPQLNDWRKDQVTSALIQAPRQAPGLRTLTYSALELAAPSDPRIELASARLVQEQGEAERALEILERVRGVSPEADAQRARGYTELGRAEQAYRAAALAYTSQPTPENERLLILAAALGGEGTANSKADAFLDSPEAAGRVKKLKLSKVAAAQEALLLGLNKTSARLIRDAPGDSALVPLIRALHTSRLSGDQAETEKLLAEAISKDPANKEIRKLIAELSRKQEDDQPDRHRDLLRDLERGRP